MKEWHGQQASEKQKKQKKQNEKFDKQKTVRALIVVCECGKHLLLHAIKMVWQV